MNDYEDEDEQENENGDDVYVYRDWDTLSIEEKRLDTARTEAIARGMVAQLELEQLCKRKGDEAVQQMTEELRGALAYGSDDEAEALRHQARALDKAFRRFLADATHRPEQQIPLALTALKAQNQYRKVVTTMKWFEQLEKSGAGLKIEQTD